MAITDRIANLVAEGSRFTHTQLRRQVAFDRLLARVFSHDPGRWILKGGGGLLARIPDAARATVDIDLNFAGQLETATEAIETAAEVDLKDYFRFEIIPTESLTGTTPGRRLKAEAILAGKVFDRFGVDVVVGGAPTMPPDVVPPLHPVKVPGLWSPPYLTHPVANQLADKYLAMITLHAGGQPSSRHRDLVDIVLLATRQTVKANDLHAAIQTGLSHRGLNSHTTVELPSQDWGNRYRQAVKATPNVTQRTVEGALKVARALLDPVLQGKNDGTWNPTTLAWEG